MSKASDMEKALRQKLTELQPELSAATSDLANQSGAIVNMEFTAATAGQAAYYTINASDKFSRKSLAALDLTQDVDYTLARGNGATVVNILESSLEKAVGPALVLAGRVAPKGIKAQIAQREQGLPDRNAIVLAALQERFAGTIGPAAPDGTPGKPAKILVASFEPANKEMGTDVYRITTTGNFSRSNIRPKLGLILGEEGPAAKKFDGYKVGVDLMTGLGHFVIKAAPLENKLGVTIPQLGH